MSHLSSLRNVWYWSRPLSLNYKYSCSIPNIVIWDDRPCDHVFAVFGLSNLSHSKSSSAVWLCHRLIKRISFFLRFIIKKLPIFNWESVMSYVHGCFAYTHVCASGEVTGALGDQKRTLDVLELELQTILSCSACWKSSQCSQLLKYLSYLYCATYTFWTIKYFPYLVFLNPPPHF